MPSLLCMPLWACDRQVDSLDKRQCNLQSVPGEVERYSRTLEELLLDMNHVRDLPKFLFRMPKLRRLGLSDNDIHRLPPDVAHLQSLVELNLSRNDISDLPEELRACRQLLLLDISSNPIARLPDSITSVHSLTNLSLNDTSLTKLPQDIGRLASLKSLEVRENHLRSLPPSIAQLHQLLRLDLGQNELDELPSEIGALRCLQELYVDENALEVLPDTLLQCTGLEQLDVSSNRLMALPQDIGELTSLQDLTLSHNCLGALPSSIGRLKRVTILRADDNSITQLTPAIGSCSRLEELFLMQNLISELPSTIGNLSRLQNLNLDKNQLSHLPTLIGDCQALTILSLRDNQLEELPLEVGKLSRLRVFDVCNNRLTHLPFTVNVLFALQALWLSENQSQALLKLRQEVDPRTGIKVLTCYLLPQRGSAGDLAALHHQRLQQSTSGGTSNGAMQQFVGGPKVHFGGDAMGIDSGEDLHRLGQFQRHDTPHPRPHQNRTGMDTHYPHPHPHPHPATHNSGNQASISISSQPPAMAQQPPPVAAVRHKSSKTMIDGHIIPRVEERQPTTELRLTKKISGEQPSSSSAQISAGAASTAIGSSSGTPQAHAEAASTAISVKPRSALKHPPAQIDGSNERQQQPSSHPYAPSAHPSVSPLAKSVAFHFPSSYSNGGGGELRLKRVNTPHRGFRFGGGSGSKQQQQLPASTAIPAQPSYPNAQGMLAEWQPPPPHTSNKTSQHQQHQNRLITTPTTIKSNEFLHASKEAMNATHSSEPSLHPIRANLHHINAGSNSSLVESRRVLIRREPDSGLGLSIAGGVESTPYVDNDSDIFVSKLTAGGAAERAGLRIGDKVLEVNGTPMVRQRHDLAVQCIQQSPDVVELVVSRQRAGATQASAVHQAAQQSTRTATPPVRTTVRTNGGTTPILATAALSESPSEGGHLSLVLPRLQPSQPNSTAPKSASSSSDSNLGGGCGGNNPYGFSLLRQPNKDGVWMIANVMPSADSAFELSKLSVGDQVLSINGQNVQTAKPDEVNSILSNAAAGGNELYLVVKKGAMSGQSKQSRPVAPCQVNNNNTSVVELLGNGVGKVQGSNELLAGELPLGDTSMDGVIEEVEIHRDPDCNALGLSVVGGTDHCSHPFGVDRPGVFISKIAAGSPAYRSHRLRIGDRILRVNGRSVEAAKHNDAVNALKAEGAVLQLAIRHERQPPGLREVRLMRASASEPLGLSICGGINSPSPYTADPTDEGIFIERLEAEGAAERSGALACGLRLLEVNNDSLLGCTRDEAAQLLRSCEGDEVRLLVCEGISQPELLKSSSAHAESNGHGRPRSVTPSLSTTPSSIWGLGRHSYRLPAVPPKTAAATTAYAAEKNKRVQQASLNASFEQLLSQQRQKLGAKHIVNPPYEAPSVGPSSFSQSSSTHNLLQPSMLFASKKAAGDVGANEELSEGTRIKSN